MRLYSKLFALVLAAAALQRFVLSSESPSEVWFGMRCSYAYVVNDEEMIDRLVVEAREIQFWKEYPVTVNARSG
jgi:hypothetical protein